MIVDAQEVFRNRKVTGQEGRYGTLKELVEAGLLPDNLLLGRHGYRFEVLVSDKEPEFLWMAICVPEAKSMDYFWTDANYNMKSGSQRPAAYWKAK